MDSPLKGLMQGSHWGGLITRFMSGQIVVHLINLVTGILIVRLLSIEEFAVYVLASVLLALASLGSDMGVSQGVVSLGATKRGDKPVLGALVRDAIYFRRLLFALAAPIVAIAAFALFRETAIPHSMAILVTVISLGVAWVQQSIAVGTSILNIHHDAGALNKSSMASAVARLILVVPACMIAPYAITALSANLAGAALHATLVGGFCRGYLGQGNATILDFKKALREFAFPLVPGIVYYLLQGQISVFLLGVSGATTPVAEVGALIRLGQILAVLMLLNGFFVQPHFARIPTPGLFAKRAAQLTGALLLGFGVLTASTIAIPEAWLWILGPKYAGLSDELIIAMLGAQLSVFGAVLYTMVIATLNTRGQWLQIPLGVIAVGGFLAVQGVQGTRDALVLSLIPAATYVLLQSGLLARILVCWKPQPYFGK